LNLKFVTRVVALLVLSLWAQNAAALSCGPAAGNVAGNTAAEFFANANEGTCGSATFAAGPTKDGHIFYANEFGVSAQIINNGNIFTTLKNLSCPGALSVTKSTSTITAHFSSAVAYSAVCTLSYIDGNGQLVTHMFGAGSQDGGGALVGYLNASSVTSGWFERIRPTVVLSGLASTIGSSEQTVTATFSEPVFGFGPLDLNLQNAIGTSYTVVSDSVYVFGITHAAGGGDVLIEVPAGGGADLAGNLNLASNTLTATADSVAPTVTLSSASAYVGIDVSTVSATFSEAITGFTAADITVSNLNVFRIIRISATRYDIEIRTTGNGPASLNIGAATVQDLAGNANTASNTLNLTADSIPPTATVSGLPATVYTGIKKTVTINFNEPVTGFTLADINSGGATLANLTALDAATYTLDLTPTGGATVIFGIVVEKVYDRAQNFNADSIGPFSATNAGTPTPIAAGFTVAPDLGTALPHTAFFTDTSTPTSGEALTSWAWDFGDGNTSTVQNPVHSYTTNGVFTITLQACDAGGCSTATGSVTVATSLASLSATLTGLSGVINGAQTITLTFPSELQGPILAARAARGAVGSLALSNFVTTNLTLSNLVEIRSGPLATDPDVWTFTATPIASGPVSVFLPANVVQNTAGTLNTVSNTLSATADLTPPTVVLSGLPANIYDVSKTVTATFSEPVRGFSLSAAAISSTGLALSNLVAVSGQVYTFDVLATALGPVSVQINPRAVTDGVGNENPASNLLSATALGGRAPIAASFTASATTLPALPASVTFADTSTPTSGEALTSWAWDFGDGSTSSQQNPSHNFTANGVFTVTLQVCDPVGCDSTSSDITVNAALGAMTVALTGFDGLVTGAQTITLTTSNRVDATQLGGLTLDDFTSTNLTLGNLQQTVVGTTVLDQDVWTLTATPDALGAIALTLPADVVQNFSGTGNTAANVLAGTNNTAPVANAGADQVVVSGATVVLDASASSDPDNVGLTYSWAAPAGITLSNASAASPSFTADALAIGDADVVYSFTLTVFDGIDSAQDTVQITVRAGVVVTLSGLPAEISGPGSHTISIVFSRAVSGFTVADISVTGGTVSSLSGSGASFSAVIAASGTGDLTVSVAALVATDANAIGNAASNVLAALNTLNAETSKEIAHFLQTRTNALLANQPRLSGFLQGGGAGQFSADITRGGGTVAFDSGSNAPIWARLNANWSTDLGAESRYIFGVVGGHSKLSNNLLIGAMLQFDHLSETNGPATTQGTGWLIGPYFAAKLASQPLYFEGSLLYGQSSNTVSPLGTFTDNFTTERWLATLGVSGRIERGALLLTPFLDAKYTTDAQAAYLDGLGNPIAAQTIGLAQASAGLDFELALTAATALNGGVSGSWSYSSGSLLAPGYAGGRARVDLGITHRFSTCGSLDLSGFYDGIGKADYERYGLALMLGMCF